MNKIFNIFLMISLLGSFLSMVPISWSQEEDEADMLSIRGAAGELISVNPVDGILVISCADDLGGANLQETFYVTRESKLLKDEGTVSLTELSSGDEVSFDYILDAEGAKKILSLWIEH